MAINLIEAFRNPEAFEQKAKDKGRIYGLIITLLRSRYFVFTASFYTLVLLILGPIVVSHNEMGKALFEEGEKLLVLPASGPPPPPVQRQQSSASSKEVSVKTAASAASSVKSVAARRLTVSSPSAFVQAPSPVVAPTVQMGEVKVQTDMAKTIGEANIKRLQGVRDFQAGWGVKYGSGSGGGGTGSGSGKGFGKTLRAKFTVFQAKYQDGDWYCNSDRSTTPPGPDAPHCGSLEDLMLQIKRWSKDRIDANLFPEVLDVGTDQLFAIKPPFVFLTGHKNFKFLDKEVKNLRDYLMLGGAVWADSALAGRRSRFDTAFRREMKRVMPDRDFEIIPPDHEMFDTYFTGIKLPSGMNFYQEPAEMINIGDELAVLYTLNGHGHLWETRLDDQGMIEKNRVNVGLLTGTTNWIFCVGPHLGNEQWGRDDRWNPIIYRNINDDTVRNAYKFGINVVVHLLTRYQDKFRQLPKSLPAGGGQKKAANVPTMKSANP